MHEVKTKFRSVKSDHERVLVFKRGRGGCGRKKWTRLIPGVAVYQQSVDLNDGAQAGGCCSVCCFVGKNQGLELDRKPAQRHERWSDVRDRCTSISEVR